MDNRQLNPLKTGALFVAPGQIMDPGIMKLRRYPDHLSRLRADAGITELEPAVAPLGKMHGNCGAVAVASLMPAFHPFLP